MVREEDVWRILKRIPYPGMSRDLVSFGMIKEVSVDNDAVRVQLSFVGVKPEVGEQIRQTVDRRIREELGIDEVHVDVEAKSLKQQRLDELHAAQIRSESSLIPGVRYKIAVASGKGGVGKSTVAANLALMLAKLEQRVGLLDADVYGPNLPMMLGVEGKRPQVVGRRILPVERAGVKLMSLALLAPTAKAMIWRGPLVGRAIEQMLRDTDWGELDFLVIDLPPGTGDAQLTLSQRLRLTGAVMVTTPQKVALADALKGIHMFQEVEVPIVGLVENMATFVCPSCGAEHDVFPAGEAEEAAGRLGVPYLGKIPLDPRIAAGGDRGEPIVLAAPDGRLAEAFRGIAQAVLQHAEASRQRESTQQALQQRLREVFEK